MPNQKKSSGCLYAIGAIVLLVLTINFQLTMGIILGFAAACGGIYYYIKKDCFASLKPGIREFIAVGLVFTLFVGSALAIDQSLGVPQSEPTQTTVSSSEKQTASSATELENSEEDTNLIPATVIRVVDGDTIEVNINGSQDTVRLIGVDTPETVDPDEPVEEYGVEASEFTKSHLENKNISLELDVQERDKYGRLLAYVWLNDKLFNETLVSKGFAQVATYPPNIKYVDKFTSAQATAQSANVGLWGIEQEETSTVSLSSTSTQASVQAGKYVGSINSDKYHYPDCVWAKKISPGNEIWFNSIEEAKAAGYIACKVCCPPGYTSTSQSATSSYTTPIQSTQQDITVYVTNTGSKYHRDGCRYLSKSRIPMSLSSAKAAGYTPCSVCGPPR